MVATFDRRITRRYVYRGTTSITFGHTPGLYLFNSNVLIGIRRILFRII